MEIEVLMSKKNELEFVIKGERHTFPALLRSRLLKDSAVEFAAYKLYHPLGKDSTFIVKTKGKPAKKALQDALKKVNEDLDEFHKAAKALK